jgi:alkylation response protein AidB-like acyl-CoA dehydrogenase
VSLDLSLGGEAEVIARSVARLCADRGAPTEMPLATGFWRGLAQLGLFALGTSEGGGAREIAAAMEALGRANAPGPLAATFAATQLLTDEDRGRVAAGEALVSLGDFAPRALMPWAPAAAIFLVVDGRRAYRALPIGAIEPVATLGGEPWGRVDLARADDLGDATRALALADVALAAYLAAAGHGLVEMASEHARTRIQFGRPIGDYQAVAHALADCALHLDAAAAMARLAARSVDERAGDATARAASARLSSGRAALAAAHTAFQTLGALGITDEGPVFPVARRIRQLVSQPPGEARARAAVLAAIGLPSLAAEET